MDLQLFRALAALLCAVSSASALLNCSRWRPAAFTASPPSRNGRTQTAAASPPPGRRATAEAEAETKRASGAGAGRPFLEPLLHACMQAHPYDTSQLPLLPGAPFVPLRMSYSFMLHRVVRVDPDEQVVLAASIRLEWRDRTRAWAEQVLANVSTSTGGSTTGSPPAYANRSDGGRSRAASGGGDREKEMATESDGREANGWLARVNSVHVPIGELWRPTWALVNSELDDLLLVPDNRSLVEVQADGTVTLTLSRRFVAFCELDVKRFPYDTQVCTLLFHLFYYSREQVALEPEPLVASVYEMSNGEWELLRIADEPRLFRASVFAREPDGGRAHTPLQSDLAIAQGFAVNLTLRRYSNFYTYNLVCPVLVLSLVSVCAVLLPAEMKLELAITVLLGFMMLQTIVAAHVPCSDTPPRLATYILSALLLAALNVVTCALVIHAADREFARPPAPPPAPLARAIRLLSRLLNARVATQWCAPCVRFGFGIGAALEETESSAAESSPASATGRATGAAASFDSRGTQAPAMWPVQVHAARRTRHLRSHAHTKRASFELSRLVTTSTGPLIGTTAGLRQADSGPVTRDNGPRLNAEIVGVGPAGGAPTGSNSALVSKNAGTTGAAAAAAAASRAVSWTTVSDVLNQVFGLVNLALLLLVMAIFILPLML